MTHSTIRRRRRPFVLLLLVGLGVLLFAFITGSIRYGGPDGLLLRVRLVFAQDVPHPAFVPTPLPVAAAIRAADLVPALATRTVTPDEPTPARAGNDGAPVIVPTDEWGTRDSYALPDADAAAHGHTDPVAAHAHRRAACPPSR
ncbi:MAG: hypothetical protein HZY76_09310 [Anaerolineae bacterium]|nr:MAG: hypothetical protein HZY76_09310 [Anaerolineae bacterium]